ncbi:AAA family ATPase [Mesorhizobium sp. M0663]|uniref:AAA family ATPase n=1 Tax=Mesorhizobium sp. M0663 TaxID=2956981 RepID=UPI00333C1C62
MVQSFRLLQNVGQFDNVSAGAHLPLARFALLYAENGRGKTTLAAILRSLASGNANLILERRRLTAAHSPQVVIGLPGDTAVFQNGRWSQLVPDVVVFDDRFVSENVYSGMSVDAAHRQKLHELIIGAQGLALNSRLQGEITRIEQHNRQLASSAEAISADIRGRLTIDQFCALEPRDNLTEQIQEAERNLAAARSAREVAQQSVFAAVTLPRFDLEAIERVLALGLEGLENLATERLDEHFAALGEGGEAWVEDGMNRMGHLPDGCPFCAQPLAGSTLIQHYRAYFSDGYTRLKRDISDAMMIVGGHHNGDAKAAFERSVRVLGEQAAFWSRFMEIPDTTLDTARIVRLWNAAHEAVFLCLSAKSEQPLEMIPLPEDARSAVEAYHTACATLDDLSARLIELNTNILLVKERSAAANLATLSEDLAILRRHEARIMPAMDAACTAYLDEKAAKASTETARAAARAALDNYRGQVFPAYETAINAYLKRFNAGFRLTNVASVNNRSGSAANYAVTIDRQAVPLVPANDADPGFHTVLSAGDRNALALAFFFASLNRDPRLAQKIVVIDDPMTSLDEHRSLTTVREIVRLLGNVQQVIVLSHSKSFLYNLWEETRPGDRSALKVVRDHGSSTLVSWDVSQDNVTEHDRRHALIEQFIRSSVGIDEREVAAAIRPKLEAFLRVAYPTHFPAATLLGPFIGAARQRLGTPDEFMNVADINELEALKDYGNLFHHDTNPAWQTVAINDQQLLDFSQRTIRFTRRS